MRTEHPWKALRAILRRRNGRPVDYRCVDCVRALVLSEAMAEEVTPHPKSAQLARGPKRQRRIVATKEEWAAIAAAKQGPCRICRRVESNGSVHSTIELH